MAARRAARPEPEPELPAPALVRVKHRPKVRPAKPVDALALMLPGRTERGFTVGRLRDVPIAEDALEPYAVAGIARRMDGPASFYKPAEPPLRGAEPIIRYLAKHGVKLVPTGDGAFAAIAEAGALDPTIRNAIEAAKPLLRAHLHGSPMRCSLPYHVGAEPPEAITLAIGGAGWCGSCGPS